MKDIFNFPTPAILLISLIISVLPLQADDIPVAPLPSLPFKTYPNAIRMENDFIEAVIIPARGGLLHLSARNQPNVLEESQNPPMLPTSVKRWEALTKDPENAIHPKRHPKRHPKLEPKVEWECRAWKSADNTLNCQLTRSLGKPFNVKMVRNFILAPNAPRLVIEQSIERFAPGSEAIGMGNHLHLMTNPGNSLLMPSPDTNHRERPPTSGGEAKATVFSPPDKNLPATLTQRVAWVGSSLENVMLLAWYPASGASPSLKHAETTTSLTPYDDHAKAQLQLEPVELRAGKTLTRTLILQLVSLVGDETKTDLADRAVAITQPSAN